MLVRDVMQSPVKTISTDAPLAEAVAVMIDHGVDCVVATETEPSRKVGVLTETDVLGAIGMEDGPYAANGRLAATLDALRGIEPTEALDAITVEDAIRQPVVRVKPTLTLQNAVLHMREESVTHLVVSEQLTLKGTVAHADIGRHLDDIIRETRTVDARRPNWERNS